MPYLGTHTRVRVSAGHRVLLQAHGTLFLATRLCCMYRAPRVLSFLLPPA